MVGIKSKRTKGFTLVELLVAIVIFSIIGGIAAGVLLSGLRAQRQSLAYQELLGQTSYLMEYMSRALRMAKKDLDGSCTGVLNLNYRVSDSEVEFVNHSGDCQKFYLSENRLKEDKNKGSQISNLTSANLRVSRFDIDPLGGLQTDDFQPRIAIFFGN